MKKDWNICNSALALYCITLVTFVFYRAYSLSLTHDEALSYFISKYSLLKIFTFDFNAPSNSHLLYTLLLKGVVALFGNSEIVLRLPALFGFLIYIFFAYTLSRKMFEKWTAIISFILLTANPFIIDFFSLARGYSLALGLLLATFYFAYQSIYSEAKLKYTVYALLPGLLAAMANFAFTTPVIALWIGVGLISLIRAIHTSSYKQFFKQTLLPFIITFIPTYFFVLRPLLFLKEKNELYLGGNHSFVIDTIWGLVRTSLYDKQYFAYADVVIMVILVLVVVTAELLLVMALKQKDSKTLRLLGFTFGVLALTIIGVLAENYIFNMPYVVERAAIYFIPLFMLAFCSLINGLKWGRYVGAIFALIALLHLSNSLNPNFTYNWKYDADTKAVVRDIDALHAETKGQRETIVSEWLFDPSINYYSERRGISGLYWASDAEVATSARYFLLLPFQKDVISKYNLRVIKEYPTPHLTLPVRE